jgi:hypothetical protein
MAERMRPSRAFRAAWKAATSFQLATKLAPSPLLFGALRCVEFVQIMGAHKAIGANTPLDLTKISLGAEHPCCIRR